MPNIDDRMPDAALDAAMPISPRSIIVVFDACLGEVVADGAAYNAAADYNCIGA